MKWYRKVLVDLIRTHCGPCVHGAEVGVAHGKTSEYLLKHMPGLSLLMVDCWCPPAAGSPYALTADTFARRDAAGHERAYQNAMARTRPYKERRIVMRQHAHLAAAEVPPDGLDFVFIDGDHSYPGVMADLICWRPSVRFNGLLCGHDYVANARREFGVYRAVNEYAAWHGLAINRAEGNIWWCLV